MSVRIRLARMGSKKRPFYRIVAADARCKRDGRFLEKLGTYDPTKKTLELNNARFDYWQGVGAQPTNTVNRLVVLHRKEAASA
ncbi:MAG: 30S ribosomal protein S16 [Myxococcales bacterium]|nr:30S ribosomal protein S16 [Myxococcales bacterium]MCB9750161.1 30S ribosomal protein S16 [Myxococcales bacterium]